MVGKKIKRKQVHGKTTFSSPSRSHSPSHLSSCNSEVGFCPSNPMYAASDSHPSSDGSVKTCRHMEKGIDVDKLSFQVSKAKFSVSRCQDCAKEKKSAVGKKGKSRSSRKKEGAANGNSEAYSQKKWICLACGHVACGEFAAHVSQRTSEQGTVLNSENNRLSPTGHACKHSLCSRHPLALQTTDNLVWCFLCKMAVDCRESSGGSLKSDSQPICVCPLHSAQKVLHEKLVKETGFLKDPGKEVLVGDTAQRGTTLVDRSNVFESRPLIGLCLPRIRRERVVKGLMNLGNTCFFNSVMQNVLALDMLRDYFSQELDSLEGPLSSSLRKLYLETNLDGDEQICRSTLKPSGYESGLRKGSKGEDAWDNIGSACNPRALFGAICAKAPRFRGFQQQDSHELLRCLLDGLASEERSTKYELARSSEDTSDARSASSDCQFHMQTGESIIAKPSDREKDCQKPEHTTPVAVPSTTIVDKLFGGQLCSTVCCCECGHSSVVFETMLDLSLPIPNPKGQTSVVRSGPHQRSSKQTRIPSSTILNKVSHPSGPLLVDAKERSLQGGQSAQASLASLASPSSPTSLTGDNCFGWLEFVGGEMQFTESSEQGSCVVERGATSESSLIDERDRSATVVEDVEVFSSIICAEGDVYNSGSGSTVLRLEEHGSRPLAKKLDASTFMSTKVENVEKPSALFDGEDGSLPIASGIILLSHEPLKMSMTDLESPPKCSLEGISTPSSELQGDYLDGFSQLFKEEENCFLASGNMRPASENLRPCLNYEESQAVDESVWEDRSWEANTIVYGPASQTVANAEDSTMPMSLEGCLSDFTKPELLYGENAWECECCTRHVKKKASFMKCKNSDNVCDKYEERASVSQNDSIDWGSLTGNGNPVPEHCLSCDVKIGVKSDRFRDCIPVHQVVDDKNCDSLFSQSNDGQETVSQSSLCLEYGNVAEIPTVRQDFGSAVQCNGYASIHPSALNCCLEETRHKSCNGAKCLVCGENVPSSHGKLTTMEAKSEIISRPPSGKLVKRGAIKKLSISKAPVILTVHLNRFAQDVRGRLSKLSGHVSFPKVLDPRPFLDSRCIDLSNCFYQLVGVVEHQGTTRGGHYIAYVRSPTPEETVDGTEQEGNDVWYYISDSSVRKALLQAVLNSEAYLLFYEKCGVGKNDN